MKKFTAGDVRACWRRTILLEGLEKQGLQVRASCRPWVHLFVWGGCALVDKGGAWEGGSPLTGPQVTSPHWHRCPPNLRQLSQAGLERGGHGVWETRSGLVPDAGGRSR